MMNEELIQAAKEYAQSIFAGDSSGHDYYHTLRVHALARNIATLEQADVLTVELAVRFLDDYLRGDPYFKINYPDHNLVRTRCQIALAQDMLRKLSQMEAIVRECVAAAK